MLMAHFELVEPKHAMADVVCAKSTSTAGHTPAGDLPPLSRTNRMEVRSVNQENDGYEEESIYRATDRWLS
jgi:hypothetical protein